MRKLSIIILVLALALSASASRLSVIDGTGYEGFQDTNTNFIEVYADVAALSAQGVSYSIETHATSDTFVAADLAGHFLHNNTGASGAVTMTLPAGADGYKAFFRVTVAQILKVLADGTEKFRHQATQGAAGGYIQSAVVGTTWEIEWSGTEWLIAELGGVLTVDGSSTVGILLGGLGVTITAEDAATTITMDEQTFEVEGEGTASQLLKIINANNAAATITLEGTAGRVNQDTTSDASPQFTGIELSHASANTITASGGVLSIESVALLNNVSEDTSPQQGGDHEYNEKHQVFNATLTSDNTASGDIITVTFGENVVFGQCTYPNSSEDEWMLALATNAAAKHPCMGIALETKSNSQSGKLLLRGTIRDATYFSSVVMGDIVWLSDTAAGDYKLAAPSDTGDIVQIVGFGLANNYIFFNPDYTYVEIP